MNIFDKLVEIVSPERAWRRYLYRQGLKAVRNYDAGKLDRLNAGWTSGTGTAEQMDAPYRDRILHRARDLERNNDIAKSVILAFERNVVGRGFNLQARTTDNELNRLIEKKFKKWCRAQNCDISGKISFREMLRLAVRRPIVDGEKFFRKVYDYSATIPFKLQLLEPDQLDTTIQFSETGNRIKSGVEVDKFNKPVAYWFYKDLPDNYYSSLESIRIQANEIIHLFPVTRSTQVRGMSALASSMESIRDTGEYLEAERVKARIAACFAVFVKHEVNGANPYARVNSMKTENGQKIDMLEPGIVEHLLPGQSIEVANPGNIPTNTKDFVEQNQRLVGSGQGLSYEMVSRDVSKVSYSSARQGLLEDRRTFEPMQDWLIEHFCTEIYIEWFVSAVLAGELPIKDFWQNKDDYLEHVWIPPGWTWIDPLKDVTASSKELDNNLTTLEQICAEQGLDWREVVDQRAKEIEYLKEKGLDIVSVKGSGNVVTGSKKTK
ncbi:phage portal protein [Sporomusa sphaeroides DSM 2875]|uniref:phage portal protein n=1 Tax=Sporomusa sphaeroides TaxID=47679 RepID=UPI002030D13E|nr:phage portal protein [Sporomusa sphaeroides]MCM0759600.1 phage portal protein [Sporomusa sphaeroides DSM 2875]